LGCSTTGAKKLVCRAVVFERTLDDKAAGRSQVLVGRAATVLRIAERDTRLGSPGENETVVKGWRRS